MQEALDHLRRVDPRLGQLIERVGPFRLAKVRGSPFEALLRSIVYQQLSGKAAAVIHQRLLALVEARPPRPEDFLALSPAALRSAGLSPAKVAAVQDLCARASRGEIPDRRAIRRLADEEIIARLIAIRGIGRWSVEMLLIFNLGRLDVLPVHDYGVRKGFALVYRRKTLPTPREILDYGERWRPYRSVATWYFWRAIEPGNLLEKK